MYATYVKFDKKFFPKKPNASELESPLQFFKSGLFSQNVLY